MLYKMNSCHCVCWFKLCSPSGFNPAPHLLVIIHLLASGSTPWAVMFVIIHVRISQVLFVPLSHHVELLLAWALMQIIMGLCCIRALEFMQLTGTVMHIMML
jgi:hypothetical protein